MFGSEVEVQLRPLGLPRTACVTSSLALLSTPLKQQVKTPDGILNVFQYHYIIIQDS